MVCFAACVIVSFQKRGKKFPCTFVQWHNMAILVKNGVTALFSLFLFCEFIIKNKTCPTRQGTYIYTILHQTDRQIHGSFELDRLARKQYHSWQNVRIIYLTERGKREKERKLVKKR